MHFSFNVSGIALRAFGFTSCDDFVRALNKNEPLDKNAAFEKPKFIPMMTARRLSLGCRLGVDAAMELTQSNDIDAVVFSSRSGELEHNNKLLSAISDGIDCSPTDFSMSVHNCGVGNYTILSKKKIPSSSVSAAQDSFAMALCEAYLMLNQGFGKVLVVDYDVKIPEFFLNYAPKNMPSYPKAVGLVLEKGDDVSVMQECFDVQNIKLDKIKVPYIEDSSDYQSINFVKHYLLKHKSFMLLGSRQTFTFNCK